MFFGGPQIGRSPGEWLRANAWRLRGLKTADGEYFPLPKPTTQPSAERTATQDPDLETWEVPASKRWLTFKKTERGYLLIDCRPSAMPQ